MKKMTMIMMIAVLLILGTAGCIKSENIIGTKVTRGPQATENLKATEKPKPIKIEEETLTSTESVTTNNPGTQETTEMTEATEATETTEPTEATDDLGNNEVPNITETPEHINIVVDELIELTGDAVYNFEGDAKPITEAINQYSMVNKKNALADDYIPGNLREPKVPFSFSGWDEKRQMEDCAATGLENLFKASAAAGNDLKAVSGYRSYKRQTALFNAYVDQYGVEKANQFSARPGQSEHQTGLAMDVSCAAMDYELSQSFEETKEGKWLINNAHEYGFIVRYPKGKSDITGYMYEPWHYRFVGIELATYLFQENLTIEEFYEMKQSDL